MAGLLEAAMRRRGYGGEDEQVAGPEVPDTWEIAGPPRCVKCGAEKDPRSTSALCTRCDGHKPRACLADGCLRKAKHHGYCAKHWHRVTRGLDLDLENEPTQADVARARRAMLKNGIDQSKSARRTTKNGECEKRTHGEPSSERPAAANEAAVRPFTPPRQMDLFGPDGGWVAGRAA